MRMCFKALCTTVLTLSLLAAGCGDDTSNPSKPSPTPSARTGKTACGTFGPDAVFCNNNQHCVDQVLNRCEDGCTSDENCVEAQVCVKTGNASVGACQNKMSTPADPCTQITCDAGKVCRDGACVVASTDPCDGVTCDAGKVCSGGACVTTDPCAGVSCDAGKVCSNGACVATDPCAGVSCDAGKVCRDGACVTTSTSCQVTLTAQDGCGQDAICLYADEAGNTACESYPECGAGGACAPGLDGAVCSSEVIAGKTPMCLTGACITDAHCPASNFCIKIASDPVGYCDDGRIGSTCMDGGDCGAGLSCDVAFTGEPGFCTDF